MPPCCSRVGPRSSAILRPPTLVPAHYPALAPPRRPAHAPPYLARRLAGPGARGVEADYRAGLAGRPIKVNPRSAHSKGLCRGEAVRKAPLACLAGHCMCIVARTEAILIRKSISFPRKYDFLCCSIPVRARVFPYSNPPRQQKRQISSLLVFPWSLALLGWCGGIRNTGTRGLDPSLWKEG